MASYPPPRRRANREGTIYHVPAENRWRAALTWTDEAGKRHRRTVSGKTQAGVRQRLGQLRSDLDRGMAPVRTDTVAGYIAGWLEREKQRIRPSTWRGRDMHVRGYIVPALGKVPLSRLTPAHVERMTAELVASGRSPRTANHARVTLRRALADAIRDGLVHRNVAALARPPRVTRRPIEPGRDYLDAAQLRRLLAVATEYRIGALVTLAATTGLRQGELLGLAWEDVDWESATLTVRRTMARAWGGGYELSAPKTNRSRRAVHLAAVAVDALCREQREQDAAKAAAGSAWQDVDRLVFTDAIGRPLYPTPYTAPSASCSPPPGCRWCHSMGSGTPRLPRCYRRASRCASCPTCSGTPASPLRPTSMPTSRRIYGATPPTPWTARWAVHREQRPAASADRSGNACQLRGARAPGGGRSNAGARPDIRGRDRRAPRPCPTSVREVGQSTNHDGHRNNADELAALRRHLPGGANQGDNRYGSNEVEVAGGDAEIRLIVAELRCNHRKVRLDSIAAASVFLALARDSGNLRPFPMTVERRYGTRRWKATRLRVLRRDLWACWVPDCAIAASVADHIDPASPAMPDARFFDETNLRASCKRHNTARGVAARLEREASGLADLEPRNPLTAPLYRPAPPASSIVARESRSSGRSRVAYHAHTSPSGFASLIGYMTQRQPLLDGCPPECPPLPKAG